MTTDEPAVDPPVSSVATGRTDDDRSQHDGSDGGLLVTFVPRLAPELATRTVPSYTSTAGSMLSADISGFTALSERLAGKGKAGAEEITELVNRCFTALITAAHVYDGEVIKFGGDALLVLFRGDDHTRRAVDAGLAMQEALRSSAAAKRAHLTMTVGVADGPFDVFLVGSSYRELLITGLRATEVIRLEGEAAKGDTLVSASIAAELPAAMLVREEAGGWVVTGSTGMAPPGPRRRDPVGGDLSPYVPTAVREQLAAFAGMGGEHRLVTVGFLMVTGIDASLAERGTDGTAAALHDLVDAVGTACAAYGVTLLHTDIAPDGLKFVLCAGAPINPGDTSDAMLQAALRIATIETPFVLRQGVQTGRVFAGFLGSPNRRTYTLMGDPVNTAARMLGQADDRDVVAVASVVAGSRTVFVSEPLEPFHVKGKAEPIAAHKVRAASDAVRRDTTATPLIGRQRELAILTSAIGELGEVVELVGPAGVGKSRLLDAAWDRAEGLRIFQAACTPYGAGSPYSVFRPLLRGGTGIPIEVSPDEAGRRLTEIVAARAPDLLPMLPLLVVPFGATVPPTPEADAIDPQFRRARIHETVVALLDATLDGPVFLVAEDLHWVDDASADLLAHLVRTSADRPWAAVLTRRPSGTWQLPGGDHVRVIELQPLTDGDIRKLAIEASDRPLADTQLDVICERAGGNPLFALELVRAMAEAGIDDVPDSIERLISARIDALPPEVRRAVRVASVLGNVFASDEALDVLRAELGATEYEHVGEATLAIARRHGILEERGPGRWAFFHALYRDTAYEGLPFGRRRRLHHLAARTIEGRANSAETAAALLSLHYGEAGRHDEAWRYSLIAADTAERQNATAEAALALGRARRAGRHRRDATPAERSSVEERLADLSFLLGNFAEAEAAFHRARRLGSDPIAQATLMRKIGSVRERQGRAATALRWYRRAAARLPSDDRSALAASARARIALEEAGLRHRLGDNERCLTMAQDALEDAEAALDESAMALALERMHVATVFLRRADADRAGVRALQAHQRVGDRSGMARVLINLGIESYFQGDWDRARQRYLEAAETAYVAGGVILGGTATMNSAEILADQGQWERALDLFDDARRNFAAVGYPVGEAAAALFSAVPAMRAGLLDEADERLTDALERLNRLGVTELVDDARTRAVELSLLRGDDVIERAAELIDELGGEHPFAVRLRRIAAIAGLERADPGGLDLLVDCLGATGGSRFDRALVLDALARYGADDPRREAWRSEADAIFAELGVDAPPPRSPADLLSSRTSR